jgi:prefoldin subunit 5
MNGMDKEIGALQADVENIKERLAKFETKVDEIHTVVTKAKTGWLILIMVGGALTWIIQTFLPYFKKVAF